VLAAGIVVLATDGSAHAASFTWTGGGAVAESKWSNPANWEGTAPAGAVGTLTFPTLGNPACAPTPATATCYQGTNDLTGLSVEAISIDDGVGYFLGGNAISLGAGGLSANTASSVGHGTNLSMPVTLTAPQTWNISGNRGLGEVGFSGAVSGAAQALTVNLSNQTFLGVNGDFEVGPVTVTGVSSTSSLPGTVSVGGGGTASLNSTDHNPVSVRGGAGIAGFGGSIGPLSMNGGQLQAGSPGGNGAPGTFSVLGSLSLESTELSTFVLQPGGVPGTDYSQLNVSGNVQLSNARLRISGGLGSGTAASTCPALSLGEAFSVLTVTGSLSGQFTGVPNGGFVRLSCSSPTLTSVQITYGPHGVTATVKPEEPRPLPILGKRETVKVVSGVVLVRAPGTPAFVPLHGARSLPDGSELETAHGRVQLTAATATPGVTESAEAYTGRFVIHQEKTARAETHLTLSLPLTGCHTRRRTASSTTAASSIKRSRPRARSRHLWVSEHGGNWGTNGHYVSTSVEGTQWLTLDECNRSVVVVTEGKVSVRDLIRRTRRTVTAGHRYVASRRTAVRRTG
jgi:hypothetical protein